MNTTSLRLVPVALATALLVAACGGGDDTPTTTVSGSVVKGPVNGASVCAFKAVATGKGEQLGCTTTGTSGTYSLSLAYQGDVVIEASGGSYTDEATNLTKTLADPMQVVLGVNGGTTSGVVTPLTAAAFNMARSQATGVSSASFATAAAAIASQFQLSGVNLATTVPAVAGTTNAYGNVLRAVSQYVANGNTLASVLSLASPATLQAGFGSAYSAINGSQVAFTFTGATGSTSSTGSTSGSTSGGSSGTTAPGTGTTTPTTPSTTTPSTTTPTTTTPGTSTPSTSTPTTGTGTGSTGTGSTGSTTTGRTLVVTVTVSGITTSSTINNVPAPTTQAQFCDGLAADTTFTQLATSGGGTLTINSCSFNGTTGNISATLRITAPIALTVPYTIVYTYR